MIFVFDGVRMNTFPARAGAAVRGGVARPRSAAPSLGPSLGAFAVAVARLRLRVALRLRLARSCASSFYSLLSVRYTVRNLLVLHDSARAGEGRRRTSLGSTLHSAVWYLYLEAGSRAQHHTQKSPPPPI